ncbi:MAG: SWIM zinc finger family protein, partial [Dechloromonas sp.]|nr:SWIM zinc finger family protein [Dechloromonas sp.]
MKADLITTAVLEDLAGATAFRRGEEYFSVGAVGRLRVTDDRIVARVAGNESYQVELRDDEGALACDCTCPRAADGYFCKHCVAVGLAWLAEVSAMQEPGKTS